MVSPCVDVLRRLASRINGELGSQQGSKHTIPDLEKDMSSLMSSLAEHDVYVVKEGRVLDPGEAPVPDVLSTGLAALSHGTSTNHIAEFNTTFNRLRERRKLTPVANLVNQLDDNDSATISTGPHPMPLHPEPALPIGAINLDVTEEPPYSDTETDESEDDENLFADSPTLTRFDEADVDLDMDGEWNLDGSYDEEIDDSEDEGG